MASEPNQVMSGEIWPKESQRLRNGANGQVPVGSLQSDDDFGKKPHKARLAKGASIASEPNPVGPNHGDVFAAASIAKAFFEASIAIVKDYGEHVRWCGGGRAQAAATLAQACATVYAAQMQAGQSKGRKTTP
jgi:hypothetical protein